MKPNKSLGAFLRSHRLKLEPSQVGIRFSGARRTAGLRREEVAERAGISAEWYAKLEQGRAVSPSPFTLTAVGSALLLSAHEQEHLQRLAVGSEEAAFSSEPMPATLSRMISELPQPAYITGQRWDLLSWNDAADSLFDFSSLDPRDRNILVFMMTDKARTLFAEDWLYQAQRVVSLFRPVYDRRTGDVAFEELVSRLHEECPEFAGLWSSLEINSLGIGSKTLHCAGEGPVEFDHASFQVVDMPSLRLVIYSRKHRSAPQSGLGKAHHEGAG